VSTTARLSRGARRTIDRAVSALTYSVDRLAQDLRITPGTLFNYRKGRTRAPRAAIEKLARILRRQAHRLERMSRSVGPPG